MEENRPTNPGYLTDLGSMRTENQDALEVRDVPGGILMALADGMGGHLGGSMASRMTIETIGHEIGRTEIQWNDPYQVRSLMEQAILRANTEVYRAARQDDEVRDMGTTALVVIVQGRFANVVHVGDSRLYIIRDGRALRVTRDHTQVQTLVDTGRITPGEARTHPEGHLLVRAIGIGPQVEPEVCREPIRLRPGDALVLCTDGLHDIVEGKEIARAVMRFPPQTACEKLVDLANSRGGPDNISVVIYRRDSKPELGERLHDLMNRQYGEIPLRIWLLAFVILLIAAVFLGMAVRAAPRPPAVTEVRAARGEQ